MKRGLNPGCITAILFMGMIIMFSWITVIIFLFIMFIRGEIF